MPVKIGNKTFKTFNGAVNYVMRSKKFSKERASAYVASIDRKQHPKKHKKKR